MGKYSYKLYEKKENTVFNTYREKELRGMTTYQLQEICRKEKLAKSVSGTLDHQELIRLIMRFRGQKETEFINRYEKEGYERLEELLRKVKLRQKENVSLEMPAKLVVYEDTALTYFDRYFVRAEGEIEEGNVLLTDDTRHIYGIFQLRLNSFGQCYLTKGKEMKVLEGGYKRYTMIYFGRKESKYLADIYFEKSAVYPDAIYAVSVPIGEVHIREMEEADMPLIIDFGSSNTTAGIYLDKEDYFVVRVQDPENGNETPLIPSVVGILSKDSGTLKYVYGYDAVYLGKNSYEDENIPIFYDLKRWVNNPDKKEKIITANGNSYLIERKVLLKGYMEYIIDLAKQQAKREFISIKLLAPVRQKRKFQKIFEEILSEYETVCEIDEGTAVVFNSISRIIEQNRFQQSQWYAAMVIDCGGGTTDLTSCMFRIENNRVSYQIDLQTSYENGNTNFGGNNMTYRILQLLKIKLAGEVEGRKQAPFDDRSGNLFRLVDQDGIEKIYEELNYNYKKAEEVIPTKFKEYENKSAAEYYRVKNNYYSLYEAAEQIKKIFFSNLTTYEIKAGTSEEESEVNQYIKLDRFKLTTMLGGRPAVYPKGLTVDFTLYEIQALLKPDIYNLMKQFLDNMYKKGSLLEYSLIKLTGQSCCSGLFLEALKEFIPGRMIRSAEDKKEKYELKLCCLYGALSYYYGKKSGYWRIQEEDKIHGLPYEVTAFTHENVEKVMIESLVKENVTGSISRFLEGEQVTFYLKDQGKNRVREYQYRWKEENANPITYFELDDKYLKQIKQDETDTIINGECKFFVWADREEWGFYVLPILRKNDQLYQGQEKFYEFEDDTWEENFFAGTK